MPVAAGPSPGEFNVLKVWKTVESDHALVQTLSERTGLPLPLVSLLVSRGFTASETVDRFLNPRLSDLVDPSRLPDMEKAVDRIWKAIEQNESIVVFGDYDVDGISSTALLVQVLTRLGAHITPFLPHRIEDGYGLSVEPLKRCMESWSPKLLITVDCGTGSVEAVEWARSVGLDVVVTDHHEASGAVAPAQALVNPKLGTEERIKALAGVGVAFKLCHALVKKGRESGVEAATNTDLRDYLDLVGIGTIADIVPLQDENRIYARYGLARLNKTESIGLKSLIEVAGIKGEIEAYHVGFILGPRLNAAGRIGDAQAALELLLTDRSERARVLAMQLDRANRERQDIEARIVREATTQIDAFFEPDRHFSLVVASEQWHAGVVGIVASRLSARYRRPAIVIALDESGIGRGSCRSIEGFDLVHHLGACSDLLMRYGGHAMAAGLELKAETIETFREKFNEVAAGVLAGADLRPVQTVDAWLNLGEADSSMLDALDRMRPFGFGNPTPVFAARGLHIVGQPRIVGNGHLKMALAEGGVQREAIGFNMGEREIPEGPIDAAFQLQRNTYLGRQTIQLNLQDFRPSAGG